VWGRRTVSVLRFLISQESFQAQEQSTALIFTSRTAGLRALLLSRLSGIGLQAAQVLLSCRQVPVPAQDLVHVCAERARLPRTAPSSRLPPPLRSSSSTLVLLPL
jgi:hypothetical protein